MHTDAQDFSTHDLLVAELCFLFVIFAIFVWYQVSFKCQNESLYMPIHMLCYALWFSYSTNSTIGHFPFLMHTVDQDTGCVSMHATG